MLQKFNHFIPKSSDEVMNALSHGVGFLLSLVGFVMLMVAAFKHGSTWHILGCFIYCMTLTSLYAASTLYHLCEHPELKKRLRVLDHVCIYLLIAGTYTPFTFTVLRGPLGWTLFAIIWGLAFVGIIFKIFYTGRFNLLSTFVYLFMGWLVVIAVKPMLTMMPFQGILCLIAGGIAYTFGVVFYLFDHKKFFHAVWHGFVMAGSVFQFAAVFYAVTI